MGGESTCSFPPESLWEHPTAHLDTFSVLSGTTTFLLTGLAVRYFKMVLRLLEAIFFLNFFLSNLVTAINTSIMVGSEGFEPADFLRVKQTL